MQLIIAYLRVMLEQFKSAARDLHISAKRLSMNRFIQPIYWSGFHAKMEIFDSLPYFEKMALDRPRI